MFSNIRCINFHDHDYLTRRQSTFEIAFSLCLVASHQAIPAGHNLNASHAHVAIFQQNVYHNPGLNKGGKFQNIQRYCTGDNTLQFGFIKSFSKALLQSETRANARNFVFKKS